jgi:hypothetical protein
MRTCVAAASLAVAGLLAAGGFALAEKWQGSIAVPDKKAPKAELAKLAKLSIGDAEKAALEAVKGEASAKRVVEAELKVKKKSLVYEATVVVAGQKGEFEVIVDAGNGKVLEVEHEDDDDDDDDKKNDKSKS